jgi:hypothetical protein
MESFAGTPHMCAIDAVKDNVYALARQAVNFFDAVPRLVINREAQV